ncbi:hypothetical protein Trydic_g5480 [Trypoxylus dichotomus]
MNLNNYSLKLRKETLAGNCLANFSIVQQARRITTKPQLLSKRLEDLIKMTGQELTIEQRQAMKALVGGHQVSQTEDCRTRRRTSIARHRISIGDTNPIQQAPRTLPLAKRTQPEKKHQGYGTEWASPSP